MLVAESVIYEVGGGNSVQGKSDLNRIWISSQIGYGTECGRDFFKCHNKTCNDLSHPVLFLTMST